ncbi:MAG: efflux RND transporter permease subunit, partial [Acetobacteraceae bacterium]|nr:efflux RND transporter permease subunit [Acetobacteraceae bacterium]
MNVSAPFIHRPIATSLIVVAIFLAGLAAYPFLPVAPLPSVEFPTLSVTAQYPGASPQTMATAIATPLETQFGQIPGLSQMTSVNVLGTSQITLQFDLNRSIDAAANDVLEAINAAAGQLPKDMPNPPTFRKTNPADAPILIMGVTSDTLPMPQVDSFAENILAQQLSQVSGVAQVLVGGQQTPAVRVQVDPGRLAGLGLTLEDVRAVLSQATANAPKGTIDGPSQSYAIYANDQRTRAEEYENAIVAYRGNGPVRVRDIGEAVDGPQNREVAAWQNNKPA